MTIPSEPGSNSILASAVAWRPFTVAVVLPAYNEVKNLPTLLDRIVTQLERQRFRYMVMVVDDGSRDETPQLLEEYAGRIPLRHYRHAQNMGLGPTIRDGLKYASEVLEDNDLVVTMDADQTHNPGLIPRMVQSIVEGHDIVIASRYRSGARVCGLEWHRILISWLASILFRVIFPIPGVRDYTCGFRAYRVPVLRRAFRDYGDRFVDQKGFQCMSDILMKLRRYELIMGEVPFILRYDLKEGESKMRLLKTALSTLRMMFMRKVGI